MEQELEIFYQKNDFIDLLKKNSIIIVSGSTGCGKSTYIPLFMNEFYSDKLDYLIGMTQPRRIAAVSIASRLNCIIKASYEMNMTIVSHHVMYENNTNVYTKIKVMTEGILLKEIYGDFLLKKYNCIILDEIHERSTQFDLILLFLTKIIKKRLETKNELKVILMSATLTDKFTEEKNKKYLFENISVGHLNIESKRHKVNVFYEEETPRDIIKSIYEKIMKILEAEYDKENIQLEKKGQPRSILVFLATKRDIYTLKSFLERENLNLEILPLHSGLCKEEQDRIFYAGKKIILATNIAETSITVPDIYYVIDSGIVKNKYTYNHTVTFKEESITKHNAIQRMGRAGRTGPGVCFRMYSYKHYDKMYLEIQPQADRETPEEILYILHNFIQGTQNKIYKIANRMFNFTEEGISWAYWSLNRNGIIDIDQETGEVYITDSFMFQLPLNSLLAKCFTRALKIVRGLKGDQLFKKDLISMISTCICSIQMNVEVTNTVDDFGNKSDFERYLKIFYVFSNLKEVDARKAFCTANNLLFPTLVQVEKLRDKIIIQSGYRAEPYDITDDLLIEFNKIILTFFKYNIAKRTRGDEFIFNEGVVYVDPGTCVYLDKNKKDLFVLFEHAQISKSGNVFIKNIALVDEEYLEKNN